MKAPPPWNESEIGILRKMWLAGASAREIAVATGKSRSGVIGRARRLGLPRRPNPIRRLAPGESRKPRAKAPPATPEQKARRRAARAAAKAPWARGGSGALAGQKPPAPAAECIPYIPAVMPPIVAAKCQWIDGEPRADDACKCLAPSVGGAYCQEHIGRVFSRGRREQGLAE